MITEVFKEITFRKQWYIFPKQKLLKDNFLFNFKCGKNQYSSKEKCQFQSLLIILICDK